MGDTAIRLAMVKSERQAGLALQRLEKHCCRLGIAHTTITDKDKTHEATPPFLRWHFVYSLRRGASRFERAIPTSGRRKVELRTLQPARATTLYPSTARTAMERQQAHSGCAVEERACGKETRSSPFRSA